MLVPGHLKHSSDGEASLKSLKSKSLPPPTDSILPAMERTPNQAAFLKNLGKTYLTSIQEYASMTGISQAVSRCLSSFSIFCSTSKHKLQAI